MSFEQDIQRKEFERRLHILKGFTNLNEVATIQISTLVKSIGAENIYEHSGLKRMTKDVLTKGNKEEIFKAKQFINNLQGMDVLGENGLPTTVYVEKGHMDFSNSRSYADNSKNRKENRVGQQYGGKNTEDDKPEKQSKQDDLDSSVSKPNSESDNGSKSVQEYATDTSSDDLQNYIDKNPDGEHVEDAQSELQSRDDGGEQGNSIIDNADPEEVESLRNSYRNMDDNTLNKYIGFDDNDELSQALMEEELNNRNHPDGEESYPDAQNDTAEIMQQFMSLDIDKQSEVMAASIEHNVSIKAALAMSGGADNTETHAKIDAAQNALNDLKSHTGHPDGQDDTNQQSDEENWDNIKHEGYDHLMSSDNSDISTYSEAISIAVNNNESLDVVGILETAFEDNLDITELLSNLDENQKQFVMNTANNEGWDISPEGLQIEDTGAGDNTGFEDEEEVKGSEEKDDMEAIFGSPNDNEPSDDEVRQSIKDKKADQSGTKEGFQESSEKSKELDAKENLNNAVQWIEDFISNSDNEDSIGEKELYDNVPDEYRDALDDAINEYDRKTLEELNKNSK